MKTPTIPKIPMSSPDLNADDRRAVRSVMESISLSIGPRLAAFEKAFCEYTGAKHAVGVNSGTAGLHLCVRAAGLGPGDLVLTTPFSFVASSNVLLFENAVPVFVDVDPRTGNIDPGCLVEAARDLAAGGRRAAHWLPRKGFSKGGKLKAILPVDVFGQPADLDAVRQVADEHSLKVIEDSCEALGSQYKGRMAGRLGDYGVYAFYPNKQITTGEGGVVVTDDDRAAEMMRALRNQGRAPGDTWLSHTYLGYNYRLDEMSAALGVSQMERIEALLARRARVASWYEERLDEIPGIERYEVLADTTRMSWFVYVVKFPAGIDRDDVARQLEARGVAVRPYFLPIHMQPYMVDRFGYRSGDFPVTEDLGQRGLAVPFSGIMDEGMVERVCTILHQVLNGLIG